MFNALLELYLVLNCLHIIITRKYKGVKCILFWLAKFLRQISCARLPWNLFHDLAKNSHARILLKNAYICFMTLFLGFQLEYVECNF